MLSFFQVYKDEAEGEEEEKPTDYSLRFMESEEPELVENIKTEDKVINVFCLLFVCNKLNNHIESRFSWIHISKVYINNFEIQRLSLI